MEQFEDDKKLINRAKRTGGQSYDFRARGYLSEALYKCNTPTMQSNVNKGEGTYGTISNDWKLSNEHNAGLLIELNLAKQVGVYTEKNNFTENGIERTYFGEITDSLIAKMHKIVRDKKKKRSTKPEGEKRKRKIESVDEILNNDPIMLDEWNEIFNKYNITSTEQTIDEYHELIFPLYMKTNGGTIGLPKKIFYSVIKFQDGVSATVKWNTLRSNRLKELHHKNMIKYGLITEKNGLVYFRYTVYTKKLAELMANAICYDTTHKYKELAKSTQPEPIILETPTFQETFVEKVEAEAQNPTDVDSRNEHLSEYVSQALKEIKEAKEEIKGFLTYLKNRDNEWIETVSELTAVEKERIKLYKTGVTN